MQGAEINRNQNHPSEARQRPPKVKGNEVINIDDIRMDGGTQARAEINEGTVAEYAEAMADESIIFPPVTVYYDGKVYWLADGFHRVHAWQRVGRSEVPADVRQGDRRAAVLHSCGANHAHGLRPSRADKRRAIMTLLEDPEWSQWSDREIGRRVHASNHTVAKFRQEVTGKLPTETAERIYTTKHGSVSKMDTTNIGASQVEADGRPHHEPAFEEQQEPETPSAECAPNAVGVEGRQEDGVAAPPPAEPYEKPDNPYGYTALSANALLEMANGLRADLDDTKAKLKATKTERDDLKEKLREATSGDLGRALGNAQRQRDTANGRLQEELAKNARLQRKVKNLEAREIEL